MSPPQPSPLRSDRPPAPIPGGIQSRGRGEHWQSERSFSKPRDFLCFLSEENPTETINHRAGGGGGVREVFGGPRERAPPHPLKAPRRSPRRPLGTPESVILFNGVSGGGTHTHTDTTDRSVCVCVSPPRRRVGGCRRGLLRIVPPAKLFPSWGVWGRRRGGGGGGGPGSSSRVRNVWFPPALGTVRT